MFLHAGAVAQPHLLQDFGLDQPAGCTQPAMISSWEGHLTWTHASTSASTVITVTRADTPSKSARLHAGQRTASEEACSFLKGQSAALVMLP